MACDPSSSEGKNLYIPWSSSDDGTRPLACDSTTPYWTSVSMWLVDSTDSSQTPTTQVTVGRTYVPHVTVKINSNAGSDFAASQLTVQLWVSNYTVGFGPFAALPSTKDTVHGGDGTFSGGVDSLSGPGNSQDIAMDSGGSDSNGNWLVGSDALINTGDPNSGHVCMAAVCWALNEGPEFAGAALGDGQWCFCYNPHVGQRNLSVVAAPGGHKRGPRRISFPFFAANPLETPQSFIFELVQAKDDRALREPDVLKLARRTRPPIELRLSPLQPLSLRLAVPGQDPCERVVRLGGHAKVHVALEVVLDAKEVPGNVHVFDVLQTTVHGVCIGGARVIIPVIP